MNFFIIVYGIKYMHAWILKEIYRRTLKKKKKVSSPLKIREPKFENRPDTQSLVVVAAINQHPINLF